MLLDITEVNVDTWRKPSSRVALHRAGMWPQAPFDVAVLFGRYSCLDGDCWWWAAKGSCLLHGCRLLWRRASIHPLNGSVICSALISDNGGRENKIGYLYWTRWTIDFSLTCRVVPFNTKSLRNIRKAFLNCFFPCLQVLALVKSPSLSKKRLSFHLLPSEITCSSMNKWCVFQELTCFVVCLAHREQCSAVGYVLSAQLSDPLWNGGPSLCILSTALCKSKTFMLDIRTIKSSWGIVIDKSDVPTFRVWASFREKKK